MKSNKNPIDKIYERFNLDPAGFSVAFTKIFYDTDGKPQKIYPKQLEFLNLIKPNEKIVTVVKSRQCGLTTAIRAKVVHKAFFGKVPEVLITSTNQVASQKVLRQIKDHFLSMPEFMQPEFEKETESQIRLANGVTIYSLPASPDACRGFTGEVLMDEYSIKNRKDGAELWEALFPCTTKGYDLCAIGTPKYKDSVFFDLINPKYAEDGVTTLGPVADKVMKIYWWDVPHVASKIDRLKKGSYPKMFLQEYCCEFLDDEETAMFGYDFITKNVINDELKLIDISELNNFADNKVPPDRARDDLAEKYPKGIYLGWDIAVSEDGSICVVFGVDQDDVWTLLAYKKFIRDTDLTIQVRFVDLMAQYFNAKKLAFDCTGGLGKATQSLLRETSSSRILHPFIFTNASKTQEYSELRTHMERGGFQAPRLDEMIKEFGLLGYNPVTGRIGAIGSHRSCHDDWPSAIMCAFTGRKRKVTEAGFSFF